MTQETIEGELIEERSTALATQHTAPALFPDEDPERVLEVAAKRAKALMNVVEQQKLYANIQGKKHLTVEAWQTLAILSGVTPFTEWCRPLENGWEARVTVRNSAGLDIGAAEAQCTRDERMWSKRDDYALRSMCQTRACSKAIRSVLSFIAVLAGFEPTPSDEMPGAEDSGAKPNVSERDREAAKASRSEGAPISRYEEPAPPEPASKPIRTPISIKAKASLNALLGDDKLVPIEVAEAIGECLRDGRTNVEELETEEEARIVYKALLRLKERVTTETPM